MLDRIEAQMKTPLPTPPVTNLVIWYSRGIVEEGNAAAAIVTKVEDAGKVSLTIFPPMGMPIHKKGVLFEGHPQIVKNAKSHARVHNGVWAYPEGKHATKSHYDHHLKQLQDKKQAFLDQQERQRKDELRFAELKREEEKRLAANVASEKAEREGAAALKTKKE